MIVTNLTPYNKEYYYKKFFTFYKVKINELIKKQFIGEDLHGESYVILLTAKYKSVYVYFSLLKFDLLTIKQDLWYFRNKYNLDVFQNTLIKAGFNIKDLLSLFEITEDILTAEQ